MRESFQPGVTVSEIARRHRISPQHLTLWRRAAREGRLTLTADRDDNGGGCGFVPLAIDAGRSEAAPFVDERISVEVNGIVLKRKRCFGPTFRIDVGSVSLRSDLNR